VAKAEECQTVAKAWDLMPLQDTQLVRHAASPMDCQRQAAGTSLAHTFATG